MLESSPTRIWDFALSYYDRPNVDSDCLAAQDRFGLDVTVLIFALYRAHVGQGFDPYASAELGRSLTARLVEPLRAARIALKTMPDLVSAPDAQDLRMQVKANELAAERLVLEALDRLPVPNPSSASAPDYEQALMSIADAAQLPLQSDLVLLLKRLAISAQNMRA